MILFGNICLGLAGLMYLGLLQRMLNNRPNLNGTYAGVGIVLSVVLVIAPLGLCLTSALFAATARDGFDGWWASRLLQYVLAALASGAIMIATVYSLLGRFMTASELPVSVRWLSVWAAHVFPLVVMMFCLVVLNRRFFEWLPLNVVRLPVIVIALLSVLATGGLLVERTFLRSSDPTTSPTETHVQQ
jgi:hypothetical protein